MTNGYNLADLNGDDLPDIVRSYEHNATFKEFYLNTGSGWEEKSYDLPYLLNEGFLANSESKAFIDFDGDALVDAWDLKYTDTFETQSSGGGVIKNTIDIPDRITLITDASGGTTTVAYDGFLATVQTEYPSVGDSPVNPIVVTEKATDNEFGNVFEESFEYSNASFYATSTDIRDRRFAGFGEVTKTTDLAKTTSYYHQGNSNATTTNESGDDEAKIGRAYRTEVHGLSDNLYSLTRTNWATSSLGGGATFVKRSSVLALDYDGDGDHKDRAESFSYDNTNGSIVTATQWGEVSGATDGTFTDTGSDKRTTEYTYATNTDGIVAVATEVLKDNGGTKQRERKYYYDNQNLGSITDGNLTKREDWVSGSDYVDTEWTHNTYGLPASEIDARGATTTFSYDPENLYIATTTNAEGHETYQEYDYSSGQVRKRVDPEGRVFTFDYDPLDRLTKETIPDPSTGSAVEKTIIAYTDTRGAVSTLRTDKLDGSTAQTTHTYFDGFGREIQTRMSAEESNQFVVRDIAYGDNGLVEKESLPYFGTGSSRTSATTDSDLYTEYGYDALNRVVAATTTVGTTETNYDQWIETVTDALGNDKDFTYDAFGRLAEVTEHLGGSSYDTTYVWDENDNLTKITDALGNVRNIAYDALSRRTSLEDIHDTSDTTFGTWSFSYDDNGNVASQTDPESQTVNFTYDSLNRVLTEDYTGESGNEVTYVYDTCTRGTGQLCSAANVSATTTYTYDHIGTVASETKTIDGTQYTTAYEYDRQGNQTLITYPDDSEVRYTYNKANQIEAVEQREDGGSFTDIISDFDYGPHGLVTYQLHANGASTTKTYDEDELYRLRSIMTTATSSFGTGGDEPMSFMDGEYSFAVLAATGTTAIKELPEEEAVLEEVSADFPAPSPLEVEPESVVPASSTDNVQSEVIEETTITELEDAAVPIVTEPNTEPIEPVAKTTKKTLAPEVPIAESKPSPYVETASAFKLKEKNGDDTEIEVKKDRPEVRLKKWDGAVNLGVQYKKVKGTAEQVPGTDRVEWKDGAQEVHAYPLDAAEGMEDGGFEIEVVLNEKPDTNVFEFAIDGYENLIFDYQAPLDEEPRLGESCSATRCVGEDGEVTRERPENMVGSYAVYAKTTTTYDGDTATVGWRKTHHIFRPKIIDANGNTTWGTLEYKNGTLTVTVPPKFLDSAAYPVIVDPTFGYTSVGGSVATIRHDFRGSLFTTPSDYSSFDSMHLYCDTTVSTYDMKGMVVDHTSLNIVSNGVSDPETCTTSGGWKTLSFSTDPSLSASTEYLIGGISDSPRVRLYYDSGATDQGHYDTTNSYGTPQNLGLATHSTDKFSAYVTYTASGGGNSAPTVPTSLETEGQTNPTNIADPTPELTAVYNDPDSGDSAVNYRIQVDDNSDFSSTYWDSSKTSLATTTEGNRTADITYGGTALASSTTYYWRIKFWDDDDAEGAWSTVTATFSLAAGGGGGPTNATPTAPTLLETEGQTNPTGIADNTPEFTAIFNDPDTGDIATHYRIEVASSSDFSSPHWNSGQTALATTTQGTRTGDLSYTGPALASSTDYHWRIKFFDDDGLEGDWSTATATFSLASSTAPSFPSFSGVIQHLTYTYDAVGNITQIVDASETDTSATSTFTYDDLYRLTSASTAMASTSSYSRTYTYNAIGNILTKSDQTGSYTYAGDQGGSYANPHAATTINGGTYTYDKNGNLTAAGTDTNTWDYMNRLEAAANTSGTTTFAYDHTGTRVLKSSGGSTGGGSGGEEFSDTFTESSDIVLDQHTPDTGGGWVHLINVGSCDLEIDASDGELAAGPSSCSSSDGGLYRTNSQATHADVELSVLQVDGDTNDDSNILACRIQDANNMYAVEWNERDSTLYKRVAGTWTQLDSTTDDIDDGSTVKMICDGNTISFEDDGTELLSASDTSITNAGYGGLGMGAVITSGNDVSSQDLDDFTMTTLSGSGGGGTASIDTHYANNLYEVAGATTTKHIYAADMLIASVEEDTPAPKIYHNHLDHLQGTNVVTDEFGYMSQLLNYYPFGDQRIDEQYAGLVQNNRFTGHDYDSETDLTYAGARYQSGAEGRFISQDPLHIRLDRPNLLTNPQKLNSYSYVENNPLVKFDPNGESSAMFWANMQRVDNTSGGYISSEMRHYQQGAQNAVNAATSRQAQTVYTAVGLTALTLASPQLGVPANLARSMAVAGNANVAFNAYVDMQDGTYDSGTIDTTGSYAVGAAVPATSLIHKGLPLLAGPAAAAAESYRDHGQISGPQVAGAGAGGTAGFLFETAVSTSPVGGKAGFVGNIMQGAVELGVAIGVYETLDTDEEDNK